LKSKKKLRSGKGPLRGNKEKGIGEGKVARHKVGPGGFERGRTRGGQLGVGTLLISAKKTPGGSKINKKKRGKEGKRLDPRERAPSRQSQSSFRENWVEKRGKGDQKKGKARFAQKKQARAGRGDGGSNEQEKER